MYVNEVIGRTTEYDKYFNTTIFNNAAIKYNTPPNQNLYEKIIRFGLPNRTTSFNDIAARAPIIVIQIMIKYN